MVYKFFDKKSAGRGIRSMSNQQLADELHKPTIKKNKGSRVFSSFKDNICGVDRAGMQLANKYNKKIKSLLRVIDLFSKDACVVPFKDKKDVTINNTFQSISNNLKRKPKKIWVDQGSDFYNISLKRYLAANDKKMHLRYNEKNLLLLKDLLGLQKIRFTNILQLCEKIFILLC